MPRVTYATRFREMLSKDYISRRDREFIESLFSYYVSKKSLTPGRRAHFLRLEEKYAQKPTVSSDNHERLKKLATYRSIANSIGDKYSVGVFDDFSSWLRAGNNLTPKQESLMNSLIDNDLSDKNVAQALNWKNAWREDPQKQEKFKVSILYYSHTGYYSNIINKYPVHFADGKLVFAGPRDNVAGLPTPSYKEYKKIVENKYARGVWRSWTSAPKWQLGDLVVKSSNAGFMGRRLTMGIITGFNVSIPTSHAKGGKIYSVLDVTSQTKFIMEERWLKRAPKAKK